ncbi:MAG TPA: hypothetical protein VLD40_02005 [Dissulfurispiraceae bacterium]|nr:hypothetical protein [Dissulfurispiraceae bacterium]
MSDGKEIIIHSGKILLYRLYDVGYEIDLPKVEEKLKRESRRLRIERKPFSKAFEFANPPVLFQLKNVEGDIQGHARSFSVYSTAYDYGVISVMLELPVRELPMSSFEALAATVEEDETLALTLRAQLDQVISLLNECITGLKVSRFEEDYTIFFVESYSPETTGEGLIARYDLARLMLCEDRPLSPRLRDEVTNLRFSYYQNDLVVLNWDNAFIIEPSGSMEIPEILEFANAQLLELRYYDGVVDRELNHIYESVSAKGALSVWKIRKYEKIAADVMKTVAELTEITERIDTSLKVTEDVYYARIYRGALESFRVRDWESGIKKKLDIASRMCDLLYGEISNKRTELLELAIVVLIVLEIVLFIARE